MNDPFVRSFVYGAMVGACAGFVIAGVALALWMVGVVSAR